MWPAATGVVGSFFSFGVADWSRGAAGTEKKKKELSTFTLGKAKGAAKKGGGKGGREPSLEERKEGRKGLIFFCP